MLHVLWLIPSLRLAPYRGPVFDRLAKWTQQCVLSSGFWESCTDVQKKEKNYLQTTGGKTWSFSRADDGYRGGVMYLPIRPVFNQLSKKPDIVVIQAFSIWALLAVLLKKRYAYRLVIIYEGSSPSTDMKGSYCRSWLRKWILSHCDKIIANCPRALTYLSVVLQAPEEISQILPYMVPDRQTMGSDTCAQQKNRKAIRHYLKILCVGQLIPRKGYDILLEAVRMLLDNGHKNFEVTCVGSGSAKDSLSAMIKKLSLESYVHLEGFVSYPQMGKYYQDADIVAFPSREDVWGMAVMESMVWGVPVVCSSKACVSDLIQTDVNGWVYDGSVEGLFKQLIKILSMESSQIVSIGENAVKQMKSYTADNAARDFMECFNSLTKIS